MKVVANLFLAFLICLVAFIPVLLGKCDAKVVSTSSIFVYSIVIAIALIISSRTIRNNTNAHRISAVALAIIFSQFIALGRYYEQFHNFLGCFSSKIECLIWAAQSIVYGYAVYRILLILYAFLEKDHSCSNPSKLSYWSWGTILLGVRVLFFIAFYPCVFGFDAAVGLRTYLDPESATCTHHPFFIQLIHGLFFTIGEKIGHLSVGFALLSLLLVLCSCAILLYGIRLFERTNLKKKWILVAVGIYSFLPIYPYLSVYPTKDGIFAYFFLLYLFTIYELFLTKGACLVNRRFFWLHGIAGLFVCLSRHQGAIIFVIESVVLLFLYKDYWKKVFTCTLPVFVLFLIFDKIIVPLNNVEPAGRQESYGTLFQQTAYCLSKYPEDVSAEERAAINHILNCDTIASKYEYAKTDAVKNTYKYNPWYRVSPNSPSMFRHIEKEGEADELLSYQKAWFSMFLKHPLTHIEASANIFWGFFYNVGQPLILTEPTWADNPSATTEKYRFWHNRKMAQIVTNRVDIITKTPFLSWIGAVPYYNWLAIFFFSILFYRRDWRGICIFLPVLLSIGVLLICPVAFGRYVFPIVMALPLIFIYLISTKDQCPK